MMASVIYINDARMGATPEQWAHFDLVLGLTADLLPVVSNTKATISPHSSMSELGKTPSHYNSKGHAVGIPQWTSKQATPDEIEAWAKEKDYGICIQTRRIRAIDVDIEDPTLASAVREFISARITLPARVRDNASKFLLAFECTGDLYKRRFKCEHGIIELLATGQQFIAAGRHTSGVRYEWEGGLPDSIPLLTLEQVDSLWADLAREFAIEAPSASTASTKAAKLADAAANDPIGRHLLDKGWVKSTERDGRLHITCPWEAEHTTETGDSSTTYWPAHTGGYANGHFRCLHAHCEHRSDEDFKEAIGYVDEDILAEFEDLSTETGIPVSGPEFTDISTEAAIPASDAPKQRFPVLDEDTFLDCPPAKWLIKGVLPQAELAVMFGESGSGKSFMALDMAVAIAQGTPWRGHKVRQGRVVYVAAEGAHGFRNRLRAYKQTHHLERAGVEVIAGAPNLLEKADALDVSKSILSRGKCDLVIVDTFAQTTAGGNENSGEDVGKALAHCRGIHRATGAVVLLIHHAGKDLTRGARGWSGLRAAADCELEVVRAEDARAMTVTKQKDGEDGTSFAFRLETVLLGEDEDGEPITSCVISHQDGGRPVKGKKVKGSVEQMVLQVATDMIDLGGDADEKDLVDAVVSRLPEGDKKRDTRRYRTLRALENLLAGGELMKAGNAIVMGV